MDSAALVDGGAQGIARIAGCFRERGFPVVASYLIKRLGEDESTDWVLVLVLKPLRPGAARDVIYTHVALRREGRLPWIDPRVRIDAVSSDHVEASRLLGWARGLGVPPVSVAESYINGLFVSDALVAEDLLSDDVEAA